MFAVNLAARQLAANMLHFDYNFFVIMRKPSTLLKSSACLLLGISAVFGSSAAKAVTFQTYDLIYSSSNSSSLSGFFTIDVDQASPISGGIPSWFTALSLTETVSGAPSSYTLSDYRDIYFTPNSGTIDYNVDLVPQFYDINFVSSSSSAPSATSANTLTGNGIYTLTSATPQAVPGPLPILGIPAVLLYSRNLKKRIKARREASGASLT
jgi:hypothetical protein